MLRVKYLPQHPVVTHPQPMFLLNVRDNFHTHTVQCIRQIYCCMYSVIKNSVCTWYFFLWGAMKNSVYSTNPHTIDDLKMAITEYVRNVDRAILNTVLENTVQRVNKCLEIGGGTLWTLLVTFCIVIIRCTETFWSPCIWVHPYKWPNVVTFVLWLLEIGYEFKHNMTAAKIVDEFKPYL
jgi:hypothetical protein